MNITMRQAVVHAPGKIEIVECSIPDFNDEEILLKVEKIGICGSDIHVFHGKHPFVEYPVVQGHEISGVIEAVGSCVTDFNVGDRVILRPQLVCGVCRQCRDGDYNICDKLKVMGFQAPGAASEFFAVNAENVIKVPSDMDHCGGVMAEPLAVGVHAVNTAGGVEGLKVLIIGAGTIGNLTAQVAKNNAAEAVMITDLSDFRLQKAGECGVDFCFKADAGNLDNFLLKSFGEDRADIIFDCVGSAASLRIAMKSARKGTKIIAVGVYPGEILADMSLLQDRELKLLGTLMYKKESMDEAVKMLYSGVINYSCLITHNFNFEDYASGYQAIEEEKDKALKVIINLNR